MRVQKLDESNHVSFKEKKKKMYVLTFNRPLHSTKKIKNNHDFL